MKFIATFILAIFLVGCEFSSDSTSSEKTSSPDYVQETPISQKRSTDLLPLKIGAMTFYVEIAQKREEREKGLMGRTSLKPDEGMLFVFESIGKPNFWMKNTLIPLDIIWISEDKKVLDIQQAEPCREDPCTIYEPAGEALYVLEVLQGKFPGEIGDSVEF